MTYQLLVAAKLLEEQGISAQVVHVPTIKPLDEAVILESARKIGRIVTAEEAQINGGFGGAVAELLSEKLPTPMLRMGMEDRFGESGEPAELIKHFKLDNASIAKRVKKFVSDVPRYHQGF
jgi:transketolase